MSSEKKTYVMRMREESGSDPSACSTASEEPNFTPTGSPTMAEKSEDGRDSPAFPIIIEETVPWPGETYIIRDPDSGRQITLVDGELRLEYHLGDQGGYHWRCIETNGWLGFRNPSDMLHIGHDNGGNFIARARKHNSWEYFATRGHPDGGQLLLMRHGDTLWKMAIAEDGHKLVETKDEGTAWEFVKV